MRALPKNIRKGVNQKGKSIVSVKMENSEPVACIGAFVGKQLKLAANTAEKFAVYDQWILCMAYSVKPGKKTM